MYVASSSEPQNIHMFFLDLYKEKLMFYILLILSAKLMETFATQSLNETADLSKFIAGLLLGGSYAFLYLYKQSFSSEQPRARGPSFIGNSELSQNVSVTYSINLFIL